MCGSGAPIAFAQDASGCEAGGTPVHLPARAVRATDTTGAGDAFVGSLAYLLSLGASLSTAAPKPPKTVCSSMVTMPPIVHSIVSLVPISKAAPTRGPASDSVTMKR